LSETTRLLGLGRGAMVGGKLGGAIRLNGCRRRGTGAHGRAARSTGEERRRGCVEEWRCAGRGGTTARGAAAVARSCDGARLRRRSAVAALDCVGAGDMARRRLGQGAAADREERKKRDQNERLKRLRSAFHAMTGRGGRLTGRGGAASGQSLVSS
jgi:hypothetical protein